MRALGAVLLVVVAVLTGCSGSAAPRTYGAASAKLGETQSILGWNVSIANLRFDGDYALVDVDASAAKPGEPHTPPEALRFGLYGALAHPIESFAVGGCSGVTSLNVRPATAPNPDRLSGTVCLGPQRDQNQVRGVYVYSPQDRMPDTTVAYAAAYPVGLPPTDASDTGLTLRSTSADAFRADGAQLAPAALGDPQAFTGNGYMLLGLEVNGLASQYDTDSTRRGGPLMVVAAPTLPGPGLSRACGVYGASMLVLPYSSLDAVSVRASLCTQGDINRALLFASVSVIGTHAALWTTRD